MSSESPPQARRLPRPRWFDVRFLIGVAVVVIPIVIGAHILAAADRYASVYVARRALVPGQHLVADDLVVGRVRFEGQGDRYVAAGRPPVGYVVTRYVAEGELLPIAALTGSPSALVAERLVTVPVGAGHAPLDLLRGDVVDLYATKKDPGGNKAAQPRLVIGAAPVDSVSTSGALSTSGSISVVIEVPAVSVGSVVRAIEGGTLDLVRVPGAAERAVDTPSPTSVPTAPATP
ncbi:MAG TPA: hypothetical protein VHC43_17725 [Mycobacteriales bacterium]|nr:hypothetical protein [Mycobacteriales bacterium]